MRTIARGALVALLTGTILVAANGSTASAGEGRGTGNTSSNSANSGCGEYCSTRDGSPSRNGNGDGKATGRPCAGCVGKADDKNPRGQRPNGSDSNNGYECDGNKGIGKGNPAHTGCTATATSPVAASVKPASRPVAPVAPKAPVTVPVAVLGTKHVAPAAVGSPVVLPAGERSGSVAGNAVVAPQVLGTRFTRPGAPAGTLPFTGGMTMELVLAAGAMVVAGIASTRLGARAAR
jgi:hypothetical protein